LLKKSVEVAAMKRGEKFTATGWLRAL